MIEMQTETGNLRRLNCLLLRAVKALGDEGQADLACRIAWAALREKRRQKAKGSMECSTISPVAVSGNLLGYSPMSPDRYCAYH
jgi:hypothetical protein